VKIENSVYSTERELKPNILKRIYKMVPFV